MKTMKSTAKVITTLFTIAIIILLMLLFSCKPMLEKKMDSWVGQHRTQLYKQWGEPILDQERLIVYTKKAIDPDNTEFFIMYYFFLSEKGNVKSWHVLYKKKEV